MRRYVAFLVATLLIGGLASFSSIKAEAGAYLPAADGGQSQAYQPNLLQQIGYYGGGDYYGRHRKSGYEDDYDGGDDYNSSHHSHKSRGCCNDGCYKKKWVCEQAEPRCRKERECIWHYGKEYCRYVRRCYGDHAQYCKWITVRSNHCGCRRCW